MTADRPVRILDTKAASQATSLSVITLKRMRRRADCGGLPWVRLSAGRVGYMESDIENYLTARRVIPAATTDGK